MFKTEFERVGVLWLAGMFITGGLLTVAIYSVPQVEENHTDLSLKFINESGKSAKVRVKIAVFKGRPVNDAVVIPAGPTPKLVSYPRFWTGSHTLIIRVFTNENGQILAHEIPEPSGKLTLTVTIPKGPPKRKRKSNFDDTGGSRRELDQRF